MWDLQPQGVISKSLATVALSWSPSSHLLSIRAAEASTPPIFFTITTPPLLRACLPFSKKTSTHQYSPQCSFTKTISQYAIQVQVIR